MDRLPFPAFDDFAAVADPSRYEPLPEGWLLGLTDVVSSTEAVAAGRYKAVNVAGAAAISAIMNALGTRHFPFAFGGDGCVFALPAADADVARTALAQTAAWVRDSLGLTLRAALVPVAAVRADGADVRVALYRPSPHVAYAMFDGGGVACAEARLKRGLDAVPPAAAGTQPDLSGLSCRWLPMRSRRGAIVSIIARPGAAGPAAFQAAVARVIATLGDTHANHPVPDGGASPTPLSDGGAIEAAAARGGSLLRRRLRFTLNNALGWALFSTGIRLGRFDPVRYRALTQHNADTRKFDDGLLVTADLDAAGEAAVRAALAAGEASGALVYGLHRQDAAIMTCIVPSLADDGHFHFVDGADGGYVAAATQLKRARAAAA